MISSSDCQGNMHLEVEEPNLIPLLDFMLVLLVMFVMLAGPIQQVMKLHLPDVSQVQAQRKPTQTITVYVVNKKHFSVNGQNFNSIVGVL